MKPLAECLELIQGKSLEEFTREHPHPVLIGLGVIAGELQKNPAKAAGTMFLNLSAVADGGDGDPLVNQVFSIAKASNEVPADGVYIGSGTENDIVIPDNSISRQQAHFLITHEGCQVVDHGSTNGSYVNGSRIDAHTPIPMRGGDIFTVGRFSFTYYDALSFAKLLAVQAMAKQRRPAHRTPPRPTTNTQAPGVRTSQPGPLARPGNGAAVPEPWNQQGGAPSQQPFGRPVAGRPGEQGQPWSPGPSQPADWQQRAVGRPPQQGMQGPQQGMQGPQQGMQGPQQGMQGGHPSGAQGGYPPPQGYGQPGQQLRPQQPVVPVPAQPMPASWFGRLMLRLSNWLRRMAGE